jgi:flagellin
VADGISLVKTGEGAMQEIQDMLSRMKYLATQSANGTYDDDVDRANLQKEVDALKTEINRIADSSNFNGISLLDGSLSGKSQVSNLAMDMSVATMGKYSVGSAISLSSLGQLTQDDIGKTVDFTITWTDGEGGEVKTTTATLTFQGDGANAVSTSSLGKNYFTDVNGKKYYLSANGSLAASDVTSAIKAGLKANEEFASKFTVASSTSGGAFSLEAKTAGTAGAVVTGVSVSDTTSMSKDVLFGSAAIAGDITVDQVAYNSMQKFDSGDISIATGSMTADEINANIFTLDGHKFLVYSSLSNDQIKALDGDITVISVAASTAASLSSTEVKDIAAQISRVTGLATKVYSTGPANTSIASKTDIVFTQDVLKLSGQNLTLQIGDTADSYNQMGVTIDDMHTSALGLDDVDISTIEGAQSAIDTIKNAINSVSMTRGTLGAVQNRLEHTANNLSVMNENISDAESTIRDTDIAEEMTAYTKNNILVQSAQAMLAQANSVPQGVLQLLQ